MIKSSIELIAENIGFDIANSDDQTQANLLNGLGRGFKTYNESNLNMQLCYVSQKLKPETEQFLACLVDYINLKKQHIMSY